MKERRRKHDDAHRPGGGRGSRAFNGPRARRNGLDDDSWPDGLALSWQNVLAMARRELCSVKAGLNGGLGIRDQIGIAVDRVRRRLRKDTRGQSAPT